MPEEILVKTLKEFTAFAGLADEEVSAIAEAGEVRTLAQGETLRVPAIAHAPFYLVLTGKVQLSIAISRTQKRERVLKPGEFFGADLLLFEKVFPQTATALSPVQLFEIPSASLKKLLEEYPNFQQGLLATQQSTSLVQSRHFRWLGEDEQVQLVVRKHPAYLFVSLILPLSIGWVAVLLFILAFLTNSPSLQRALEWIGGLVLIGAFLFAIWRWLDWGNDYYVITDQRVVWLEEIIGLYDSRLESPLVAVRSSEVRTSLLGRFFGYGDVIAKAFMGQVAFRHIANPAKVKLLLDQCQQRALSRQEQADTAAMEQVIRRKIEPVAETTSKSPAEAPSDQKSKSRIRKRMFNYFRTRFEEGEVITYRKHYYVLIVKTWLPALTTLGVLALIGFAIRESLMGILKGAALWISLIILMLGLLAAFLWWLYQYVDWRNDIYQITSEKVIDSTRKPLGTEVIKSAPLANIQSMDYERRGLLGILLNYGDVVINVGTEVKLVFMGIHDPARAQQDIFNRMYSSQRKRQLEEAAKQWDQVSEWLAAYHRQAEELRKTQSQVDEQENSDKI